MVEHHIHLAFYGCDPLVDSFYSLIGSFCLLGDAIDLCFELINSQESLYKPLNHLHLPPCQCKTSSAVCGALRSSMRMIP